MTGDGVVAGELLPHRGGVLYGHSVRVSPLTVPSTCMRVQKQRETGGTHLEGCPTTSARLGAQGPRPRLCLGEHLQPEQGRGLRLASAQSTSQPYPLPPAPERHA